MVRKSGNLASWFLEVLQGNLAFHALDLTVKTSIQCLKFPYSARYKTRCPAKVATSTAKST